MPKLVIRWEGIKAELIRKNDDATETSLIYGYVYDEQALAALCDVMNHQWEKERKKGKRKHG